MAYVFSHGYLKRGGFPHSDIYGSKLVCQLPAAFRRLPRPSSPVIAKASTTCTLSLDPISREPCCQDPPLRACLRHLRTRLLSRARRPRYISTLCSSDPHQIQRTLTFRIVKER